MIPTTSKVHPLPDIFVQRIKLQFGMEADALLAALSEKSTTSILLNATRNTERLSLSKEPSVPWNPSGRWLSERPQFTLDPFLHAGAYYVQESSSMIIGYIMQTLFDGQTDLRCIDLCAAPGGKSLNILNFLQGNGILVSNEVMPLRNIILRENLCKWGALNKVVTRANPADLSGLHGQLDLVLVDAPCSGEGMFRKEEQAIVQWSPRLVEQCSILQRKILADAWPLVAEGGYLIFSTCTFSDEENRDQAAWLNSQEDCEAVNIPVPSDWGIDCYQSTGASALRFLPHKVRGEGLCVSVFRKMGRTPIASIKKQSQTYWQSASSEVRRLVSENIQLPEGGELLTSKKDEIACTHFSSEKSRQFFNRLTGLPCIAEPGLIVASLKGSTLIPEHGLAMSGLAAPAYPSVELDLNMALKFLRRDALDLDTQERGWIRVTNQEFSLGWVKKMDNRTNNYYPSDWRIRMAIS